MSNKIVDEIEYIRNKNNKLWMEILRIALSLNPTETKKTLKQINENDKKISNLLSDLSEVEL